MLIFYKSTMKTSETWNQGFEEMRFDNKHGHLVSEDQFNPTNNQQFIFESQELAIGRTALQAQQAQENPSILQLPDSSSARGQERYEYSQTQPGKGQESQIEDKSLRILDNSNLSNLHQEQSRNRENTGQPQPNILQHNNQLIIQVHPKQQKSKTQIMRTPPHYIPPNNSPVIFEQHQSSGYNELETLPLPPQHSYAPSQKTLVMPHAQGFAPTNPVFRSHLATERLQSQFSQHADKRIANPIAKSSYQMNPMTRQDASSKSMIQNNQISIDNYSDRNLPVSEIQWWRDKYQELRHHFQVNKANYMAELEASASHIQGLQQQNRILKDNYEKLIVQVRNKGQDPKASNQESRQGSGSQLKRQLEERGMLINLLKKQNEQLKQQIFNRDKLREHWQAQCQQLQQNISVLKMQLQQKEQYIAELKKTQSQLKQNDISQFSRSRVQSVENTRIMELEMQTGRLMAQMAARDESYEQDLKLNTLKFNELAQKYQSTVIQKDQIIRNLQEKVAILESDLNKKDSLLRNLRDELVEAQRKKTSNVHNSHIHTSSPKHSTTSASAINPPHERAERPQTQAKREIDNLRKHLFDKQRQLTIQMQRQEEIKQILVETENTANRRKNEMQSLRRQIADYEDKLAEFEMLKETLQKKNEEVGELRQILIEKQYSGQYQSLTKENQKLREISIKRNAQISDLNQRLLAAEKKIREQEGFNPQIQALQEEVEMLTNHIRGLQSQIQQLTLNLQHSNQKLLEAELQVERERQRQVQLQNLLQQKQNELEELQLTLEKQGQREQLLQRELESLATKMVKIQKQNEELKRAQQLFIEQLTFYQKQLTSRTAQLETFSQEHMQLEMIKSSSLKQIQNIEDKYFQQLKRKDHDIQTMNNKIRELEAQTKQQKDRLLRVQPELDSLRHRQAKHHNCEKQIEELTDKIINYETKMLNTAYARQLFSNQGMSATKVFENKLIYHLKCENEKLKNNIKQAYGPYLSSPQDQQQIKKNIQQSSYRMREEPTLRRVRSHQEFIGQTLQTEPAKNSIIGMNKRQESSLSLPVQSLQQLQRFYNQKICYYRATNTELQERNNNLIKLNQELKDNISRISNSKQQNIKEYFEQELKYQKEKNQRLERQLVACKKNHKRLEEELREIKGRQRMFQSPTNVSYNYHIKLKSRENNHI